MELTDEQQARIDRGAVFLDEHVPDWYEKIDAQKLDIDSFSLCILCQSCGGSFWDALCALDLNPIDSNGDFAKAADHGFYPHSEDGVADMASDMILQLTNAKTRYWLEHVTQRLKGAIHGQ